MGLFDNKTKEELEAIAEVEEAEAKEARKAADEAKAAKKATKAKGTPKAAAVKPPVTPAGGAHPKGGRRGGADRRFW